jgi:diacylglycerol kinase (ATP)
VQRKEHVMPLRQWLKSANYAIEGILHASKTQRHLRYHFYAASVVLVTSYVLGITKTEFLIISLAVIAVLVAEMVNTSIEAMVDLLSPEHDEKARAAKDIAAGAVLITVFGAAVIGYIVLFPYISEVFTEGPYLTKHPREEIAIIAFILILILVILLKAYFGRGHPLSGGMPSGHSALAFSVWMSATLTSQNVFVSLLCFLLAAVIAQSRVATKTHKPWEVILGGLLGAAITFLLFQVFS